MNFQFRAAQPGDITAAVPLIYSSGPAAFDYVFAYKAKGAAQPVAAQDFLSFAFGDGAGEFGYRNHIVAISGEQILGIGACFSGDTALSFTLTAARQILSFYGWLHGWAVIRKGLQMEHIVQPPMGALHYIAHLGIAPEWRGRGVGAQLIRYLLELGQQAGRTLAALDVAVTNPRAQALYERLGFVVTHERKSTLVNVAHHRRMEMSL